MTDRRFLFLLIAAVLIGTVVTLCTGYLTGTLGKPSAVTVSLAGAAEESREPEPAATSASAADEREELVKVTTAAAEPADEEKTDEEKVNEEKTDAGSDGMDGEASADAETVVLAPVDGGSEEEGPYAANIQMSAMSPLETAGADAYGGTEMVIVENADGGADAQEENPYLRRLQELDAQMQKIRETQDTQAGSAASNSRNSAASELKLWDSELNTIYNEILKYLDEEQTQELVMAERIKDRDAAAVEAAKNSAGGSLESVEYTASLAETTRARAYELVSLYGYLLTEKER